VNTATREAMFSSKTDLHSTPQDFFDALNAEFGFTLDVCATPQNAKCAAYFTREQDGLAQPWTGRIWCNPPYGRGIGAWVKKAAEADADLVVMLLPARTDTRWWHDYVLRLASDIRFIKGRLKFGSAKNSAPCPSAVVVFRRAG
jgi:phage N-6-adenine-methyltransferase